MRGGELREERVESKNRGWFGVHTGRLLLPHDIGGGFFGALHFGAA